MTVRGGGGGVGISAGTQEANVGNITFSNSNGVSFGLSNGVLTATVTPGAAAGIAAISAGTTQFTSGTGIFSNSNGVSFGVNGNTITASVAAGGGAAISAAGSSQNAGTVVFSNSNNVSFGMNGSTVTASASAQSVQTQNLVDVSLSGNTSGALALVSSGTLILAGGNNITLSQNGQSVTISGANVGGAQTGISGVVVSNTTYTSGTISFSNANGISFGSSAGQAITASYTVPTQSNQTVGFYASSQTTGQSSSTTIDARSMTVVGYGVISVGASAGSLLISAPGTTSYGAFSEGLSNIGNTSGNTGLVTGQMVWAGGNNVTLSGSTNAGSMTITISAGAGAGQSIGVSTGGNTAGNTGIYTGQAVLVGSNNITLNVASAAGQLQTITISGANQSNQTAGFYALGNTTQNSSTTLDPRFLSFNGLGELTVGYSNGSIQLSAPPSSIGVSNIGNTAGNTGTYSGQAVLAGGNNITLSVSSGAGGAQTITISAGAGGGGAAISAAGSSQNAGTIVFSNSNNVSFGMNGSTITASASAQSNQSLGLYFVNNTTGASSSSTIDARSMSYTFGGALSGGMTGGTIELSAPATSSISGTGLVSVVVNGSTISIGASPVQLSFFQPLPSLNTTVTQNGLGSIQVYPALHAVAFTATRADIMASISAAALAISTQAQTVSMYVGLYSLNGSTLSLASSGSQSYAFTNSSNNSNASITGIRRFSAPINVNYTGGFDLFVGIMTNTTFVNTNGISLSNVVVPLGPGQQLQGLIGQVPANSMQFVPGQGFYSATSAALPSSMALSNISGAGSGGNAVDYYAPVNFVNMTA